jgi:hypothetical protein
MNFHTDCTEHLSPNEFAAALDDALAGDVIVYAVGRLSESLEKGKDTEFHRELELLHSLTLKWSDNGKILLFQRRMGPKPKKPSEVGMFEYLAIKRVQRVTMPPIRAADRRTGNDYSGNTGIC